MIDQLEDLADLLTVSIEDACPDVAVLVTAGQPAAPSGEGDCQTVVYVWGQVVADLDQQTLDNCVVRSRFTMFYQIQTCYPENWEDPIGTAAASDAAARLYGLMSLVWCGLVAAKDAGDVCGANCKYVELAPLEVQPRQGGAVSALGGVTIPYVCPLTEDSPTSP